jgi:hypothetical protein
MSNAHIALLPGRGVVSVTGEEARSFLDNLITNDMGLLDRQQAIHAGLLTPQGKILFAFFVVARPDGFLIETGSGEAAALVKRLTMYKLRAKVTLNDLSASHAVVVAWGGPPPSQALATVFRDSRHPDLGYRLLMAPEMAEKLAATDEGAAAWHAHRIALGVPEAGLDYALGDAFPHEADFDVFHGVSFTKGCFVGQEVVARMQHKTVVRKRVVRVAADAALTPGSGICIGEAAIGRIGSAAGALALALVRLDRAAEARAKGQALKANDVLLSIDPEALARYEAAAAARTP